MNVFILAVLLSLFFTSPAAAQTRSIAELASYRGADREEVLLGLDAHHRVGERCERALQGAG